MLVSVFIFFLCVCFDSLAGLGLSLGSLTIDTGTMGRQSPILGSKSKARKPAALGPSLYFSR